MMNPPSEEAPPDYGALKRGGIMRQAQPGRFALRLHVVSGDLTASQLAAIAAIAERFGKGEVHLTARQGVEVPHVAQSDLQAAKDALAEAGLELGACGPRVRTVTGCQGAAVCRYGLIETREVCRAIDAAFAGLELPHKLKFGVSGCLNSCLKPQENDIGVMGAVLPRLQADLCSGCMVCTSVCETGGLLERAGQPQVVERDCSGCGDCIASCPSEALVVGRSGYVLYLGGRVGRDPKLGVRRKEMLVGLPQLLTVLRALVELYRARGRTGERFGRMLERLEPGVVDEVMSGAMAQAGGKGA